MGLDEHGALAWRSTEEVEMMRRLFAAWLVFTIVWVGAICWAQYPNWADLGGTTFCDCDRVAFTQAVIAFRVVDWLPLMLLPPGALLLAGSLFVWVARMFRPNA
jgi:hypothetical protein